MKPGDLVRLRSDIDFPVDLCSVWDPRSVLEIFEVGEMGAGQVGVVLEFSDYSHWRILGARVSVGGVIGWTYAEFLEEIKEG